ncbi:UPF0715 family protein [Bacillus safensis]|uniref:UPF0715 family protein n=1 Tax=Bacillus TaxID=1386 RepID=UPI00163BD644|nr:MULTISPECIES: UPF0715 family protein [Bacillus]MBW4848957.1 UPF0715 family protein [Bacillaceae bacterium]MBU5207760.1 UPF0715 family protein [Bacillus safensis]MBW4853514.1 UPF0715 family protein [Bacillaceae bacterium]MBW4857103.1 UPF0715 family protein [Bacillaceae bacterium]MCY7583872.1 UPF0715 family protein [Bacillus safensis]
MRMFLPVFNYLCMLILSVITATFVYTFLFMPSEAGFSYVEMTSLFILLAYVIFAVPIQLVLHRHPKRFRSRDLFIYFIAAWVVCSALALWIDYGLVVFISYKVYLFSFCAALIYWVLDSVFLMKSQS